MKFARGLALGNMLGGYLAAGWFLWDTRWGYMLLFLTIGFIGQLVWIASTTNSATDENRGSE